MTTDLGYRHESSCFWFVSSELLMDLLKAEFRVVGRLLADNPQLERWCDYSATPTEQRKICFAVVAHGKVMDHISETIASRYEQGSVSDEESKMWQLISNLIALDAPEWARGMNDFAQLMPSHIFAALPESLRAERFDENSRQQRDAIETHCTLEHLQTFIQAVLDQQASRLETRWRLTSLDQAQLTHLNARVDAAVRSIEMTKQHKPRRINKRKGWEQREKLYSAIQTILKSEPTLQGMKFCAALDQRHAPPLQDWRDKHLWREGLTWKEAWDDLKLKSKIRRVRQEALKNRAVER
jgi:hypothetical protein